MRINFNMITVSMGTEATLPLVLPVLGEGKGEEKR